MTATTHTTQDTASVSELFAIGAHYAYKKTRRHPSAKPYIFGAKNGVEIFDLEKVLACFEKARTFVEQLGAKQKTILFVSGKPESKRAILSAHERIHMPYVAGRWIGGTLTNFEVVHKRVERLKDLRSKQEKGALEQYTKRERLLMRREADRLSDMFGGIVDMEKLPGALFIIDPAREVAAVREARQLGIPVVALANSDCDLEAVEYPIPANDSNVKSIAYFVDAIAQAYEEGTKKPADVKKSESPKKATASKKKK